MAGSKRYVFGEYVGLARLKNVKKNFADWVLVGIKLRHHICRLSGALI
jgi:hypothetical protein